MNPRAAFVLPILLLSSFGCRNGPKVDGGPATRPTALEFFNCKPEDIKFVQMNATKVMGSHHGEMPCHGLPTLKEQIPNFVLATAAEMNSMLPGIPAGCTIGGVVSIPAFGPVEWSIQDVLTMKYKKDGSPGTDEVIYFVPKSWLETDRKG